MDQEILVKAGHDIIEYLEDGGFRPRAAMWVHNTDTDTWRLWVVPPERFTDKNEFYRRVSEIVTKHREALHGIDASDTEMVLDTHPAIKPLSRMFRVDGKSSVFVSDNMVNGFYIPDGIILLMRL
ncbi:hypothetical protein [Aquibaculum sediminis]|uniref:hypothetical protein n=1 Tax=Aquibaculum sediminis TaxID=3231907 RepID=UPI003451BC63